MACLSCLQTVERLCYMAFIYGMAHEGAVTSQQECLQFDPQVGLCPFYVEFAFSSILCVASDSFHNPKTCRLVGRLEMIRYPT